MPDNTILLGGMRARGLANNFKRDTMILNKFLKKI